MNKVILIGRLGQTPELTHVGSKNLPLLRMSVATSERYKVGEEWKETTEWHSVQVWRKLAESLVKHLQKGDLVLVEGDIHYTKKDDKYYTNVTASRVQRLNKREKQTETPPPDEEPEERGGDGQPNPYPPAADGSDDDTELPF